LKFLPVNFVCPYRKILLISRNFRVPEIFYSENYVSTHRKNSKKILELWKFFILKIMYLYTEKTLKKILEKSGISDNFWKNFPENLPKNNDNLTI